MSKYRIGLGGDSEERFRGAGGSGGVISSISSDGQGNIRGGISKQELSSVKVNKKEEGSAASARKGSSAEEEVSGFILDSSRLLSQELQGKLLEAHEERRKGELARANILCDEIIASDPEVGEAYIIKAQVVINTNLKESLWYLEKALSLNMKRDNISDRAEIYSYISGILLKLDRYEDAVIAAQSATELEPLNEEYIQIKNIASLKLRLYINSLATKEAGESMRIEAILEAKQQVIERLNKLKGELSAEDFNELSAETDKLFNVEISDLRKKEVIEGLQAISDKIDRLKIENAENERLYELDPYPELSLDLLEVGLGYRESVAAGGAGAENVEQIAESSIPAAGGAGGVTAISASGGASSFATEVSAAVGSANICTEASTSVDASSIEEYDPELLAAIESAKKAIADAPKLSDEEERAKVKVYHARPYNPEAANKLFKAEKDGNWDKILELLQEYKTAQNLGMYAGYSRDAVVQGNFKFLCKLIEKNPELRNHLAQKALDSTISYDGSSQFDLFLKLIKLYEDLGLNVNELIVKKYYTYDGSLLKKAATESKGEEGEPGRPEFFEYFLKRFEEQNFKLDAETSASVLKIAASSSDSPIIDRLIPMLKEGEDFPDVFKEMDEKVKENHAMLQEIWRKQEEAEKLKAAANLSLEEDNTPILGEGKDHEGTEA